MAKKRKSKQKRKDQSSASSVVNIGFYALAFIDILNQREKLSKITKLPENESERNDFIQKWKETFGVVQAYRDMFDSFFKSFTEEESTFPPGISMEDRNFMRRARKTEIKKQLFSDSMIYYTSLEERPDRFSITGIHTILSGCASTFFLTLSKGLVCRGGIEIGIAGEFFKGEVYGPALYQAYQLESEVAEYPRIVVGNSLLEFIGSEMATAGDDPDSSVRRGMAKKCREYLISDVDGVAILDFAGSATREIFPTLKEAIHPALAFAKSEWNRFRKEGKTKLARRYYLLHNYLLSRKQSVWK
jgi:hypothetical protein